MPHPSPPHREGVDNQGVKNSPPCGEQLSWKGRVGQNNTTQLALNNMNKPRQWSIDPADGLFLKEMLVLSPLQMEIDFLKPFKVIKKIKTPLSKWRGVGGEV
jgi:hypothetical protein